MGLHVPKQQERPVKEYLSPEFKQWIQNLGHTTRIRSSLQDNSEDCTQHVMGYFRLGINTLWIVVSESNENISFVGGGLNGAFHDHVHTQYGHDKWGGWKLPDGTPVVLGQQVVGMLSPMLGDSLTAAG